MTIAKNDRPPDHCEDCRYFVPGQRVSTEAHDGTCHASPPSNYTTPHPESGTTEEDENVITVTFVDGTYTGWPIVQATDWCGCYDARPTPRTRKPKEAQ